MNLRLLPALLSAVALAGVTACGGQDGSGSSGQGDLEVVAAFYPLQYAVEQIGGDRVSVTGLTKPGVEPHDLELTPRAVGALSEADAVVCATTPRPFQAVGLWYRDFEQTTDEEVRRCLARANEALAHS